MEQNNAIDSRSLYSIIDYKIDMVELISSVFHLILDMSAFNNPNQLFANWGCNLFDVSRIYGRDVIPQSEDENSLLNRIANYLLDDLYNNTSGLKKSGIILLYKRKTAIIKKTNKESTIKRVLASWLCSYKPISKLFSFVKEEKIKNLEMQVNTLLTEINYNKVVSASNEISWASFAIPSEWLKTDDVKLEIVDNASVWVNKCLYDIIGDIEQAEMFDRSYSGNLIGLDVNKYTIPFVNVDNWIRDDDFQKYFYQMITNVYSTDKAIGDTDVKELKPFIDVAQDAEFCKLLSFLHYNLYLRTDEVDLPGKYSSLFDEVLGLEEITNVDNLQLYVTYPSEEQMKESKTIVGIYEKEKQGTEYNLLNWINTSEEGLSATVGNKIKDQSYKKVFALRPLYSHYFSSKFFEDNFGMLLKSIGCSYCTNVTFYKVGDNNSFIEIDAILQKKDGTLVYVENKTNMNKYNVDETISKIEKFHTYMQAKYPLAKWQYLIVSPYCNDTLYDAYRYFINNGEHQQREGVKNYILDFIIPIAKFEDVNLQCVVEPEYDLLKEKIAGILQ